MLNNNIYINVIKMPFSQCLFDRARPLKSGWAYTSLFTYSWSRKVAKNLTVQICWKIYQFYLNILTILLKITKLLNSICDSHKIEIVESFYKIAF